MALNLEMNLVKGEYDKIGLHDRFYDLYLSKVFSHSQLNYIMTLVKSSQVVESITVNHCLWKFSGCFSYPGQFEMQNEME
jgi:hypothetical protein